MVFVFGGFFREPVSGKLLRRRRGDRGHQRRPDRRQPRRVHLQSLLVDNGNRFRIFGNCRGSQYFDFVFDFSYVPLIETNRFLEAGDHTIGLSFVLVKYFLNLELPIISTEHSLSL